MHVQMLNCSRNLQMPFGYSRSGTDTESEPDTSAPSRLTRIASSAVLSSGMGTRLPSQNSFFHPEGPNIGPGSADNWFHKEGDLPPKTDLLHKGHSKGGKLVIVMVRVLD
jgi:hypothetical protein